MTGSNFSLMATVPMLGENCATVTVPMLYDYIEQYEIVMRPITATRAFCGVAPVLNGVVQAPDSFSEVSPANALYVCQDLKSLECVRGVESAFAILVIDKASFLNPENIAKGMEKRLLIIRKCEDFSVFLFKLQRFFSGIFAWESALSRIAARKGSPAEFLDASYPIIPNFMFISSPDYSIVARSSAVEPPDEVHKTMIESGYVTTKALHGKPQKLSANSFYIHKAENPADYDQLSLPLFNMRYGYIGSISMACNAFPITEGLEHKLLILSRYAMESMEQQWSDSAAQSMPYYSFMQKILSRELISDKYIYDCLDDLHISRNSIYKMLVIEGYSEMDKQMQTRVAQAALNIKQGDGCLSLMHRGDFVTLIYNSGDFSAITDRETETIVRNLFFDPMGIRCGTSIPFRNIRDADLAYTQAKETLALKEILERERVFESPEQEKCLYTLPDSVTYMLLGQLLRNTRLFTFLTECSVVNYIRARDKEDGTNDLPLLWIYLTSQGNATYTAKCMSMHRNTVLYRIEKIQERCNIDLKDEFIREKLVLDYKVLFLSLSQEKLDQIFHNEEEALS